MLLDLKIEIGNALVWVSYSGGAVSHTIWVCGLYPVQLQPRRKPVRKNKARAAGCRRESSAWHQYQLKREKEKSA
jgi:hypothetical protein